MRMLILGGTVFLGRHVVEAALARGHQVTLFNRGQSNLDLFPELEKLTGNRDGGLDSLQNRKWDVALDTCGYVPRIVGASASLLADSIEHYTFISTISVYADMSMAQIDEHHPLATLTEPDTEDVNGETYGPLKALCEKAAEDAMPGRVLNIRPGIIAGPHDPTDRFTYWPCRFGRGGEIVAPEPAEGLVQFIDVRDLAEWTLAMIEQRRTGVYNATGPGESLTMKQLLLTCHRAISPDDSLLNRVVWLEEEFLLNNGVQPWIDLPLWLPGKEYQGLMQVNIDKAVAAGLKFRDLKETVSDTAEWASSRRRDYQWRAGLTVEREKQLLSNWKIRSDAGG